MLSELAARGRSYPIILSLRSKQALVSLSLSGQGLDCLLGSNLLACTRKGKCFSIRQLIIRVSLSPQ